MLNSSNSYHKACLFLLTTHHVFVFLSVSDNLYSSQYFSDGKSGECEPWLMQNDLYLPCHCAELNKGETCNNQPHVPEV